VDSVLADEAQVCAVLRWLRSPYKPLSSHSKFGLIFKKKTCDPSMGDQKAAGYAFMAVFSPSLSTLMKLTLEPKRNRKEPGLCACPSPLLKENSSFICCVEARAVYHKKRTVTLPCAALSWVYNLTFLQQAKDSYHHCLKLFSKIKVVALYANPESPQPKRHGCVLSSFPP
jgi:hypothetical protein